MDTIDDATLAEVMNRPGGGLLNYIHLSELSPIFKTDSDGSVHNTSKESYNNSDYDYLLADVDGEDDHDEDLESSDDGLDLNTYQNMVARNHQSRDASIDDITHDFENLHNDRQRINISETSNENEVSESRNAHFIVGETSSSDDGNISSTNQRYSTPAKRKKIVLGHSGHFQFRPSAEHQVILQSEQDDEFMDAEPGPSTDPDSRATRGRGMNKFKVNM